MAATSGALQLRLPQTVVDVSAEKNSTPVMPFPVETLRFFEHRRHDAADEPAHGNATHPASHRTTPPALAAAPPARG